MTANYQHTKYTILQESYRNMMTFREKLIIASIMITVLLKIKNGSTSTTKAKGR